MSDLKYANVGNIETRLIEECSELIHILCKVQRFGWGNYHPKDPEKRPNYLLVMDEIKDVEKLISELRFDIRRCVDIGAFSEQEAT